MFPRITFAIHIRMRNWFFSALCVCVLSWKWRLFHNNEEMRMQKKLSDFWLEVLFWGATFFVLSERRKKFYETYPFAFFSNTNVWWLLIFLVTFYWMFDFLWKFHFYKLDILQFTNYNNLNDYLQDKYNIPAFQRRFYKDYQCFFYLYQFFGIKHKINK